MSEQLTSDVIHRWRGAYLSEMPPASRILSAACAGTWYFQWFAERYPHPVEKHIGVELYSAPADLPSGVVWIQSSISDLSPVETGSVDLVFAGQVIEHLTIDGLGDFICEVNRVLDDDGFFVLDSPNFSITNLVGWRNPEHNIEYTYEQIRTVLRHSGFEIRQAKGILLCVDPETKHCWGLNWQTERHRRELLARHFPEYCLIWWVTAKKRSPCRRQQTYRLLEEFERANSGSTRTTLLHNEGALLPDSAASRGIAIHSTANDSPGCVLFGPYIPLPKGEYQVTFPIKLGRCSPDDPWPVRLLRLGMHPLRAWLAPSDTEVATMDVCSGTDCKVHASRAIFKSDFRSPYSYQPFSLTFLSDGEEDFQFRVYSFGQEPFYLDPYTPYTCRRRL